MTKENLEQRQSLMLQHKTMLYAYVFDAYGRIVGYLPRKEFLNLNPYRAEVKIYQRDDHSKLKAVQIRDIEDFKLATCNNY